MRSPVLLAISIVVTLVTLVTGCAPIVERARSAPVTAPAFASEEEALAAATEAYARFVDVVEAIGHDGGANAGRIREVTTGDFLAVELESFERIRSAEQTLRGTITFRDVVLQQFNQGPANAVSVYLCEDVGRAALFDAEGKSLTDPNRPDTNYFAVSFDVGSDGHLRISSLERWDDRAC